MKRITLLISVFFITTVVVKAQENLRDQIDRQYLSPSQKAFLYQVSPQLKAADEWSLDFISKSKELNFESQFMSTELNPDTTWGYSEYKAFGDTNNIPQEFNRYYYQGNSASYVTYNNAYSWFADSMAWLPKRLQTSFRDSLKGDSVEALYFRYGETEPYTGNRNLYPKDPSEGADYESFNENYVPEQGWVKESRTLSYRNEFEQDTLRVEYYYNAELMDYQLGSLQRYQYLENYYLYYNEYYINGSLYSVDKQERTPEYEVRERAYYSEGIKISGSIDYLKKEAGERYIYQVSKEYDEEKMTYVGEDSLHFMYSNDDTITEAMGYSWDDSVWVFTQAYTSFQHDIGNGVFVSDSVLIYDIVFNEETMEYEKGEVEIKTEMDYDEFGNQIEVRGYQLIDGELTLTSRTVREFMQLTNYLGDPYFVTTKQVQYGRDFFTGELYLSNTTETKYNSEGGSLGNSNFRFNAAGDTTYGYITQRDLTADGATIEVRFEWDNFLKELLLKSYRIYNRRTSGDMGQGFTQTLSSNIFQGEQSFNRSMNVYNSYPGIFNDGPIYIEMGDTLIFYVSGMNPDMSIPEIEVTNMPASATFDSETRRFFWVVDETNPSPMTYKATRGNKFVTTEVEFISEQYGVGAEDELSPEGFKLNQNYPNPFNPSTNISFNLLTSGEVTLKVYNLLGQEVATLINTRLNSGNHAVSFDASQLSSGVYIYRLQSGDLFQTKKMLLIK